MNPQVISRVCRIGYGAAAVINVWSFVYWSHDVNKLLIAGLLVAFIFNQHAIDLWRDAAQNWRDAADGWQQSAATWKSVAEKWKSEKWN